MKVYPSEDLQLGACAKLLNIEVSHKDIIKLITTVGGVSKLILVFNFVK